tara:strand:- start:393 stop:539 length:147 start_codon:yes stop_codon:yes gene_type:complete
MESMKNDTNNRKPFKKPFLIEKKHNLYIFDQKTSDFGYISLLFDYVLQ